MSAEFYVGYQPQAPRGVARHVRAAVLIAGVFAVAVGALLATLHRRLPLSTFEFGQDQTEFTGVLISDPYPVLRVRRPGAQLESTEAWSRYLLVAPGKFGAQALARGFDGATVRLRGTLVYQDERTMIEVVADSIEQLDPQPVAEDSGALSLGQHTLVGEIVDSKCQMGVMNPGERKTHRACATLCIEGGIPPLLLVREASGEVQRFLLVSADGRAVNSDVLDMVAVPVRITGEVWRADDLYILRADPATYERLRD